MNVAKKIVSYILAFILMIILTCTISLNIASKTILKQSYLVLKIESNNYYKKLDDSIKNGFEEYIQQSGLDEEVLENLYREEDIRKDIGIVINNIYENKNDNIDTNKIKTKLKENINIFLKTTKLDSKQSEAINQFTNKIAEKYESEITHTEYIKNVSKIIVKINKNLDIANKILIIAGIVIIVLILLINVKTISSAFSSIFISLLSAGTLLIIPKIFVNTAIEINTIMIIDEAFSNLVRSIVLDILGIVTKYGITFVVASAVLILITNVIKYQNNE